MPYNHPPYIPETVFITGATGDFGKAFAKRFAEFGCKLILHGRSEEKLEALKDALDTDITLLPFDMKDREAMVVAAEGLPDIDLLINNAGGALGQDPAYKADIEDWETMIEVNNTALVRLTRLVLPGMVARKAGHIVNIGSVAGSYPYPGGNVYCAVKAFVEQFSLSLRADLQRTNVRVTNIEPGLVETQFSLVRFKGDREKASAVYENTTPLTADDIAESVVWAATLPPHFNVNRLEMMPTVQAFGGFTIERTGT